MKVIYKGDRQFPGNYDNFTYNKVYEYYEPHNYEDSGEIVVTNDLGKIVQQPGVDFDFLVED
jgi:hypothetical protein